MWAQEENGADRHAVCAGQSVDGKAQAVSLHGPSERAKGVSPQDLRQMTPAQSADGCKVRHSLKAVETLAQARKRHGQ